MNGLVSASAWFGNARRLFLKGLSCLNGSRFCCRVELLSNDEPAGRDQFFQVQMIGWVPTPCDNYQTDVQVKILDVTEGRQHAEPVLSTERQFQSGKDAVFHWQSCNGPVPTRNAVLVRWITVAQVPCHCLRFASRGRRRLQFTVSVLSSQTGRALVTASKRIDYVNCSDGFRERQERKLEVLRSTLLVSAVVCLNESKLGPSAAELMSKWIDLKSQSFPSALALKEGLGRLEQTAAACTLNCAIEGLLAWGEKTDKEAALELALQTAACGQCISDPCFDRLSEASALLGIRQEHFLVQAQQCFLGADCTLQTPARLLGVEALTTREQFLKRLNDEYRRWNARVINPDPAIRHKADRMVALIADLRSEQMNCAQA
ncbi:MAG: hypothetical protein LLF76_05435 [Planctomycetaceae bacterium]|nr:hypothetical protein [Planctomycetaceae bacterium]